VEEHLKVKVFGHGQFTEKVKYAIFVRRRNLLAPLRTEVTQFPLAVSIRVKVPRLEGNPALRRKREVVGLR
jgi:hypothetical protein